jgi:hypothetical protein
MNTALDRDLGGLGTRLLFVSSDGVFLSFPSLDLMS